MDQEQARRAIRAGGIAGLVVAAITIVLVWFARAGEGGRFAEFADPIYLVDALVTAVCAAFVLGRSRTAAVALLVLYVSGKAIMWMEDGRTPGVMAVVVLFFFVQGVRGTFAHHRLNPDPNARRRPWVIALLCVVGALFVGAMTLGALISSGVLPDTKVVAGKDVRASHVQSLIEAGILEQDEEVQLFYSAGFFSVLEDGNVLTDRRVISWAVVDGERWVEWAPFDQIADVVVEEEPDWITDAVVSVTRHDGSAFYLFLSGEEDGHRDFLSELERERVGK